MFNSQLGRKFYERGFSISTIVIVKINNLTKMASRATRGSSHIRALTSVQTPTGRGYLAFPGGSGVALLPLAGSTTASQVQSTVIGTWLMPPNI